MALNKVSIKGNIKTAFTQVMNEEEGREEALDKVADALADAVIEAIKSMNIIYTTGLATPTGGGPVSGTFGYTIS